MTAFAVLGRRNQRSSDQLHPRSRTNYALWAVQIGLSALFLFAGAAKLAMPAADLEEQSALSAEFLRFIATAEVLGAIGLIVPAWLRIRPGLTPLAAAGLVVIMTGATVLTLADGNVAAAMLPFATGIAAASVAYHRRAWLATLRPFTHRTARRSAPHGSSI
jgi:hypothetical protein